MKLLKELLENAIKDSPMMKHFASHISLLAREAIRASQSIVDVQHELKTLTDYVKAHQLALEQMYAVQNAMLNASKQHTLDVSMPKPKQDDDKKKPN